MSLGVKGDIERRSTATIIYSPARRFLPYLKIHFSFKAFLSFFLSLFLVCSFEPCNSVAWGEGSSKQSKTIQHTKKKEKRSKRFELREEEEASLVFSLLSHDHALVYLAWYSYIVVVVVCTRSHKYIQFLHTHTHTCLLYTSPSPRDRQKSRMPSSA